MGDNRLRGHFGRFEGLDYYLKMDSNKVYHLLYRSFKSDYLDENQVGDIIVSARRNNTLLEITGILMYRDKIYVQLLEGYKNKVLKLYEKNICKDKRHHDQKVLVSKGFKHVFLKIGAWG